MIRIFKKAYTREDILLYDFIRKSYLFEKLTNDELSHFVPHIFLRKYKENEVVFFTGDPSQALYIVKTGIITLNLEIKGEFEKLVTLRPGRVFGENTILKGTKRIYSAIVKTEEASLYIIPKENLLEIMERYPAIKAKIMEAYAVNLNSFNSRLFDTYKSSLGFFDLSTVFSGQL